MSSFFSKVGLTVNADFSIPSYTCLGLLALAKRSPVASGKWVTSSGLPTPGSGIGVDILGGCHEEKEKQHRFHAGEK